MPTAKHTGKTARQTTAASTGPTAASGKGASLAPPPYGIAFVDRGLLVPAKRNGLPDGLKAGMESLSGLSLDDVEVHYNASQPGQLGAAAFAQGRHIHLAPGQAHRLPHEAWHVVQQAQGRVLPNARIDGGPALNDDLSLELEAEAMGAKALQAGPALAAGQAPAAAPAPLAQAPDSATVGSAGGSASVIQRWPKWLDRLRERNRRQRLVSEDEQLVVDTTQMGHRAQTHKATIEARRRDKVKEGLGQAAVGSLVIVADAIGEVATGLPIGTVASALHTAHSTQSSGRQAYKEGGGRAGARKAVGKEGVKELVGQAIGNIPVVGEFGAVAQGLATAVQGVVESDASRLATKQDAIKKLQDDEGVAEAARERLKDDDLEPAERRRLEKAVKRSDQALAAAQDWQQGKAAKGKLPLLAREASGPEDDELLD